MYEKVGKKPFFWLSMSVRASSSHLTPAVASTRLGMVAKVVRPLDPRVGTGFIPAGFTQGCQGWCNCAPEPCRAPGSAHGLAASRPVLVCSFSSVEPAPTQRV